jgi:hypothetical protein
MAGLKGRFVQESAGRGIVGTHPFPCREFLSRLGGPGLVLLLLASGAPSLAQDSLRNTFPGRRIGGATRGECSSRLIVHLVPSSSVLAPGSGGLGLLQGPSASPVPLVVELRPLGRGGNPDATAKPLLQRTLPAMPMGITLLPLAAVNSPTVWESSYACGAAAGASPVAADPLSFVESVSPPALSLLVPQGSAADGPVLTALGQLRQACGSTVATADLVRSFALEDLVRPDWPARLPVRCP